MATTQPAMTPGARRILDAATTLFYERGIHAVGVDAVAAGSGVTKRTLYDRFGSKDALVAAYLRRRDEEWWARWEKRLETAGAPRVLTVFEAYVEDAEPSGRGCAFLNAAAELSSADAGFAIIRDHKRRVRARIEELLGEDGVGEPAVLAEHLFLLLEGGIAHQGVDGDSRRLQHARAIAADLLKAAAPRA
ncbi:TetR/AcrR family transcriptional regulator [Microbacterium oryzae]|nr:TetR/AcrR family transcriptional regulator [Microbacterium oryzae]